MGYHTIHYNKQDEPYIVLKNFGHDPKDDESSSHWTWHITARGVQYLSKDQFGRPRPMPQYIDDEQLEDLKSYKMLRRSDGAPAYTRTIFPKPGRPEETDKPAPIRSVSKKSKDAPSGKTKQPSESFQGPRPKVITRRVQPVQPPVHATQPLPKPEKLPTPPTKQPSIPPQQPAATQKRGFWGWLKSLLGLD